MLEYRHLGEVSGLSRLPRSKSKATVSRRGFVVSGVRGCESNNNLPVSRRTVLLAALAGSVSVAVIPAGARAGAGPQGPAKPSLPRTPEPGERSSLIPGVHRPGPDTTGPYSVTDFIDRYPKGSSYFVTYSKPGVYYGHRIWGQVRVTSPGVTLKEAVICGPDPRNYHPGDPGCVRNFGVNPPKITIEDSRIDPGMWVRHGDRQLTELPGGLTGIHGGMVDMYRSEVTCVHDGWNFIGPNGDNGSDAGLEAVNAQSHLSQQNWYHYGLYRNDFYGASDGQPHCDGIQTNYGRNFTSRGDFIGGRRDMTGYRTWPGGYNSGDDFFNAAIQLSQEPGKYDGVFTYVPAVHELRDIIIEDGWIEGGVAGINHAHIPSRPASWAGSHIRRMKFGLRGTGGNNTLRGDGPGTPARAMGKGDGWYVIRHPRFASLYSDNTLCDCSAIPIANG